MSNPEDTKQWSILRIKLLPLFFVCVVNFKIFIFFSSSAQNKFLTHCTNENFFTVKMESY